MGQPLERQHNSRGLQWQTRWTPKRPKLPHGWEICPQKENRDVDFTYTYCMYIFQYTAYNILYIYFYMIMHIYIHWVYAYTQYTDIHGHTGLYTQTHGYILSFTYCGDVSKLTFNFTSIYLKWFFLKRRETGFLATNFKTYPVQLRDHGSGPCYCISMHASYFQWFLFYTIIPGGMLQSLTIRPLCVHYIHILPHIYSEFGYIYIYIYIYIFV